MDDCGITHSHEWWEAGRLKYNIGLVVSGIAAFICYGIVIEIYGKNDPEVEITIFTTAFQAVGYLFMMLIANVFYCLGEFTEKRIQPDNVSAFRTVTYTLGFWFSVCLPFLAPLSAYLSLSQDGW